MPDTQQIHTENTVKTNISIMTLYVIVDRYDTIMTLYVIVDRYDTIMTLYVIVDRYTVTH